MVKILKKARCSYKKSIEERRIDPKCRELCDKFERIGLTPYEAKAPENETGIYTFIFDELVTEETIINVIRLESFCEVVFPGMFIKYYVQENGFLRSYCCFELYTENEDEFFMKQAMHALDKINELFVTMKKENDFNINDFILEVR